MTPEITTALEEITTAVAEEATAMAGVWGSMGGTTEMSFLDTLSISVIGFAIVFAVLGFLAIFVFLMGRVFDMLAKKKEAKAEIAETSAPAAAKIQTGFPLPDNQGTGSVTLINVTEEEAAVIMAVTSKKSGIPLNRLKFNSIKLLED